MNTQSSDLLIITAGSNYLDIDAYACIVAMAELLNLQEIPSIAYSTAPSNYSVCSSLTKEGQIIQELPSEVSEESAKYIIVDVSDPEFLKSSVSIEKVIEVYDHHIGFEDYWTSYIGDGAHIEFIGAAATLIYRAWKKSGLSDQMKMSTAKLLIAAILDNTLNLASSNTTREDIDAFCALCAYVGVGDEFRTSYFSEVQKSVETDLKNALFGDIKTVRNNSILPSNVAQLCVWNSESVLARLDEIRSWFAFLCESWMINIIDLSKNCSYFVCNEISNQEKIAHVFDICFEAGVAKTKEPYLRKQIIKKTASCT
jgi:inorganic pyrophosphatase/manganese-dependent inorganic pyrophosphatase